MNKALSAAQVSLPVHPDEQELLASIIEHAEPVQTLCEASPAARALLAHIASGSPFLSGLVRRYPEFAAEILGSSPDQLFTSLCMGLESDTVSASSQVELMRHLRVARNHAALLIALADIAGCWSCDEVTRALTRFADVAVAGTVNWLLDEAVESGKLTPGKGQTASDGYTVLAMGKHGAGELNYSSDIDLIVLYDQEKAPLEQPDKAAQIYVRMTRSLATILQDRTEDGYVFRVDLRLRPDPRATQVAIAIGAAENYYASMGQNWERAAMIKARAVAGDLDLGQAFLKGLTPFVWRKYLDFAAIADVQSLKRQMHAHKGHGSIVLLGHNIKLGRGGIREIEFFVQTQQLIAGGKNPDLRDNRTLTMLDKLVEAGWLEKAACEELQQAYVFLRTIEHRLQMVADEQTQTLPATDEAFDGFARFCGFQEPQELADRLIGTFHTVQEHYAGLFEDAPELGSELGSLVFTGGDDDPDTLNTLAGMGFAQASEVSAIIRGWHFGRYPAMRSSAARERLTELMPALLMALSRSGQPDQAMIAFDRFVAGLPAGVQLFSMFKANPFLLELLATVLGAAPRLAQSLSRRPRQLEAVLDPDFFDAMPGETELANDFAALRDPDAGYEDILSATRVTAHELSLRIGVRILSETVSAEQAGLAYSRLADAVTAHMLQVASTDIAERHGQVKGGAMVVVALGKLGGCEMTAASDLDLIMLYDFADSAEASDGDRPLPPSQYFSRLTRHLTTALTSETGEGVLYEVDMRLRPSGNKGPVASHIGSFDSYQATQAWTWEKMALTRARVVTGDDALRQRVESTIRTVLCAARDREQTLKDVRDMRLRMLQSAAKGDHWDIKHVRGGLVEVEFIAQALQLVHGHDTPEILNRNTVGALDALRDAGHLDIADHEVLVGAATLYQGLTHMLRLCSSGRFDVDSAPSGLVQLLLRACAAPDIATMEAMLIDANRQVSEVFDRLIGVPEEP
ncbi:MAG: bifunctional [glutamine synthetase] adenylyltransferase/[glutamine synthetase]-adenylyl-L-tyrosine phosphorylase [Anderseniella sp.]